MKDRKRMTERERDLKLEASNEKIFSLYETKKPTVFEFKQVCPKVICSGYILDDKCVKCKTTVCKTCFEIEHEGDCNANILANLYCLSTDTKKCPGCRVPCKKTEGCYQVWCIMCHTTWDWNTSKIDHGRIHAKDYKSYLENSGLEKLRLARNIEFLALRKCRDFLDEDIFQYLEKIVIFCSEKIYNVYSTTFNLKLQFVQGKLDEDKLRKKIFFKRRGFSYEIEVSKLKLQCQQILVDIIRKMFSYDIVKDDPVFFENVKELVNAHEIFITEFIVLQRRYQRSSFWMTPIVFEKKKFYIIQKIIENKIVYSEKHDD